MAGITRFWICFVVVALGAHVAISQEWPQYRGPAADGVLPEVQLPIAKRQLKVHWKVPCPLGFSSFAVAQGKAITIVGRDGLEVCIALDADNGEELWSYPMGKMDFAGGGGAGAKGNRGGDGPRSTPAIAGNLVFVYDIHLVLHCISLSDGKKVWTRDVIKEYGGKNVHWHNATSPLIDENHVYVAGGGDDQTFLAFEQNSGQLKWKSGSNKLTHASPTITTINGVRQIIFFMQSGLVGVDANSGRPIWRAKFPFNISTAASPVVNENRVYCSAGYGVGAGMYEVSNAEQATEIWRRPNRLMNHWSSPVLKDNHLFGLYRFKKYGTAPLQCVDFQSGEVKWTKKGYGPGNCICVGDKLIVLSDAGELAIVSATPEKYDELWRDDLLTGKCWSTPAFSGGKIFIRSTEQAACVSFE